MLAARVSFVIVAVILGLQGCSSTPATHVLLPSKTSVPELQQLSHSTGAIVSVITVSGDEEFLSVEPGSDGVLAGKRLDEATADHLSLPFDSLALIYYVNPTHDKAPPRVVLPQLASFPELAAVGPGESGLSCTSLDTELS